MKIEAGGFYTNSTGIYAREVIDIFGEDVRYREHDLRDGGLINLGRKCVQGTFRNWATRPCTAEEVAHLTKGGPAGARRTTEPAAAAGSVGKLEIRVGEAYTNAVGIFAREVLEMKSRDVVYWDFDLSDGRPITSRSRCDVLTFGNWAARPCTPEESGRLSRDVPAPGDLLLTEMMGDLFLRALACVPDDQLLAEVRRRGL